MLPQAAPPEALPSPGIGMRHYAPRARLIVVEGSLAELPARLVDAARPFANDRLGVMLPAELARTRFAAAAAGSSRVRMGPLECA